MREHEGSNPPYDESREAPYRHLVARLEQAIGEIHSSEAFRAYLDVQARFHRYSPFNTILILSQAPLASRVMGYGNKEGTTGWKSLGRQVNKGEKAIKIFAPRFRRVPDEETGEPQRRLIGFRIVNVFDISATSGPPVPDFHVPVLEGDEGGELYARLERFAVGSRLCVEDMSEAEATRHPSLMGYFQPEARRIRVRPDVAQLQRTKTLAHELGHAIAGHVVACSEYQEREAETEAESIAYVVCAHFGLDTGQRSFPYVAKWSQDQATFAGVLGRIQRTAAHIIEGVEGPARHPGEEDLEAADGGGPIVGTEGPLELGGSQP